MKRCGVYMQACVRLIEIPGREGCAWPGTGAGLEMASAEARPSDLAGLPEHWRKESNQGGDKGSEAG